MRLNAKERACALINNQWPVLSPDNQSLTNKIKAKDLVPISLVEGDGVQSLMVFVDSDLRSQQEKPSRQTNVTV